MLGRAGQLHWRHLVGPHAEPRQLIGAECAADRDVRRIAAARDQHSADARLVVTCIQRAYQRPPGKASNHAAKSGVSYGGGTRAAVELVLACPHMPADKLLRTVSSNNTGAQVVV